MDQQLKKCGAILTVCDLEQNKLLVSLKKNKITENQVHGASETLCMQLNMHLELLVDLHIK